MSESLSESLVNRLRRGEIVPVGNKLYAVCKDCWSIVQVNKPILGSMHVCEPKGETT